MKEMIVDSIMVDMSNKTPVVILREVNGKRCLPILIGEYEASAIQTGLKNISFPRPMTHDLMNHILDKLQCPVEFVLITRIEDSTFFASIIIYNDGEKIEIDARPSDAIALALRTKSPILVHEDILVKAGIPLQERRIRSKQESGELESEKGFGFVQGKSHDDISKFKDFLNNVTPEDFFRNIGDEELDPDDFEDDIEE